MVAERRPARSARRWRRSSGRGASRSTGRPSCAGGQLAADVERLEQVGGQVALAERVGQRLGALRGVAAVRRAILDVRTPASPPAGRSKNAGRHVEHLVEQRRVDAVAGDGEEAGLPTGGVELGGHPAALGRRAVAERARDRWGRRARPGRYCGRYRPGPDRPVSSATVHIARYIESNHRRRLVAVPSDRCRRTIPGRVDNETPALARSWHAVLTTDELARPTGQRSSCSASRGWSPASTARSSRSSTAARTGWRRSASARSAARSCSASTTAGCSTPRALRRDPVARARRHDPATGRGAAARPPSPSATAWCGSAREAPLFDLPELPEWDDPAFVNAMNEPRPTTVSAGQLVDNFLDATHLRTVHAGTFGVDDGGYLPPSEIVRDGVEGAHDVRGAVPQLRRPARGDRRAPARAAAAAVQGDRRADVGDRAALPPADRQDGELPVRLLAPERHARRACSS